MNKFTSEVNLFSFRVNAIASKVTPPSPEANGFSQEVNRFAERVNGLSLEAGGFCVEVREFRGRGEPGEPARDLAQLRARLEWVRKGTVCLGIAVEGGCLPLVSGQISPLPQGSWLNLNPVILRQAQDDRFIREIESPPPTRRLALRRRTP